MKKIEICDNSTFAMKAREQFSSFKDGTVARNLVPCAKYNLYPGLIDLDDTDNNPDEAYIRLYLNTKIKVKSIVLHYDSTVLAAELGGYLGMLLGVSLVDLAVMINSYGFRIFEKIFNI